MHFQLTDEQLAVQAEARRFADEEVAPVAREADETGVFPDHLIGRMAELGYLLGPISPDYGGRGIDYLSFALVSEELGRADSSVRGFLSVHAGLVSHCIYDWGTEELRQRFLPRLATADLIGCYCLTEPGAGSDAGSLQTRCEQDGDDWIINGEKIWITNAGQAQIGIVFATRNPEERHRGICAFIVDMDSEGIRMEPMPGQELGHRASDHRHIRFDNVRVPGDRMLGEPGAGFRVAMSALDHGRVGVAAGAVGIAQACLDACLEWVRSRRAFNQRIGDFQMIQANIADMVAGIEAGRLLTYHAAWLKMEGLPSTRETSIAKLFTTEAAARIASDAVLIHGGRGYSTEFPVERYYRDIKGLQIYEGTSHIQRIVIARDVIGREPRE